MCACVCACACSTDDVGQEEPATVLLSTMAGKWVVVAYQDGTHFIPATNPEYYSFEPDGAFMHVYEYSPELSDTLTGRYTYNPDNLTIHVEEPRGWDLDFKVQFLDSDAGKYVAIFDIKGRTQVQSKTVRVQRQ